MRAALIGLLALAATTAVYLLTRGSSKSDQRPAAASAPEATEPAPARSTSDRRVPPPTLPSPAEAPTFRRMGGERGRGEGDGPVRGWRGERRAERMKQFDTNGDGELDDQERAAMREARTERRRTRNLEFFDSDGDGALDSDEQTMLDTARADMASERASHMMQRVDADSDGRISREEAANAGGRARRILRDFDAVDADGDGQVTGKELQQAMKERREGLDRREAGAPPR